MKKSITQNPHKVIFNPKKSGISKEAIFIPLKVIQGKHFEVWKDNKNFKISKEKNLTIFESEDSAFFKLSFKETKNSNLEDIAYIAYQSLFQSLKKKDLNLVRIWNYVPKVLDKQGNLERYQRFNIGRRSIWQKMGPKSYSGRLLFPATTMVGCLGNRVIIEVFASKYPVSYMQNPLQKPAEKYSKKWGPKPPSFSRGALFFHPLGIKLFVSGTASIVGEENVHVGNPKRQTIQTLKNIKVLISAKNCYQYGYKKGFPLDDFDQIRVYIKNPQDFRIIKETVEHILGKQKQIIYLQEDISRNELLVEIEGICTK